MRRSMLYGFILAATVLAPKTAAQVEGAKGVFGALQVGHMVEVRVDPKVGMVITTYDDAADKAKMMYKITEIDRDYIALEYEDPRGEVELEMRYPVSTLVGVCHMKKSATPKPAPPSKKKKTLE